MVCSTQPLSAQPKPDTLSLNFKLLNAKDGLSQGLVLGMAQDPEGFMWFATGDGLNRWDGDQMKIYRHNPADPASLPDNAVMGLALDKNGNLWIGTATQGLWRMDRKTERFTCFRGTEAAGGTINYLQLNGGWLLLVGRGNAELLDVGKVKPETKSCPHFFVDSTLVPEHFQLLPGGILLSRNSQTGVISKWDRNGRFLTKAGEVFSQQSTNPLNTKNWCYDADSKALWVISNNKLLCIETNGVLRFQTELPKGFLHNLVSLYPWKEGRLGMQVFPEGSHWTVNTRNGNVSRVISNLPTRAPIATTTLDRAGNLWIGTGGEGILELPNGSQKFHTWTRDRFIYQLVTSPKQEIVFYDQTHTIWLEPQSGLRKTLKFPFGLGMESMTPIVFSLTGKGWIPFTVNERSTLLVPDQPDLKPLHLPPMSEREWSGEPLLFVDSDEFLWRIESVTNNRRFLRKTNLNRLTEDKVFQIPASPLLHSMPFVSGFQVMGNIIWLGTTQGLFSFNMQTEKWEKHYRHDKERSGSMSSDVVLSLCPDPVEPSRFLWVGTSGGGLNRVELSTGKCRSFSVRDGLPNEVVYGILSDELRNLWLSTNKGLCCFTPPKTDKEKPVCRNFTTEDGLANDEFNRYSYTKLADGTLVFGGTNGLTWFSPKEVLTTGNPPQMAITGFSIFNKPVDFRSDSTVVKEPFPFAQTVNLSYEQDMFRVEFAALDFGPSSKKQYSYFLEGYDKKWIPGGTVNSATYTNLGPGDYTFRVKGTNSDGIWSTKEARLTICISPPWWGSWWFRSLAVLSIFGMIYGAYRYQLNQAIKVVKLRNRIALDLHDEIGSTLNSIAFFGEVANQMMAEDDQAKPVLDRMSTHAKEVVESMSDIVWSLNSKNDSFENLVDRLQSFASQMLEPKGCTVEFQRPERIGEIRLDMEQRRNLYLIVKEAINNAAKYAEATKLWVHFRHSSSELQVEIGDNGKGFDPQTTNNGNGLESMEGRAKSLGASWKVESEVGKGTRVTVVFGV